MLCVAGLLKCVHSSNIVDSQVGQYTVPSHPCSGNILQNLVSLVKLMVGLRWCLLPLVGCFTGREGSRLSAVIAVLAVCLVSLTLCQSRCTGSE